MRDESACKICGSTEFEIAYVGPIRLGRFGHVSEEDYQLRKCCSCEVIALPNLIEDIASYYKGDNYRQEVDDSSDSSKFYQLHDGEQIQNLSITGTSIFRDKIIADIGCGAGSFLDGIKGFSKKAIAIEPSQNFKTKLAEKGYVSYSYVSEALEHYRSSIDIAVSFSVLEHVSDPVLFLKEIHDLLVSRGKLVISTPNANDILLDQLPDDYGKFFYRKAHLWYFNSTALQFVLNLAGFKSIKIVPYHRFGLGNFIAWLQEKKPMGDIDMEFISGAMNSVWCAELERSLRCDYLFAEAYK